MTQQQEVEQPEEPQEEPEILLPNTTIVTHCVLKNDIPRLTKCFEDDTDPYKETVLDLLNERDPDGKSPLDIASTMGKQDMVRELLQRGSDVKAITEKGVSLFIAALFITKLLIHSVVHVDEVGLAYHCRPI